MTELMKRLADFRQRVLHYSGVEPNWPAGMMCSLQHLSESNKREIFRYIGAETLSLLDEAYAHALTLQAENERLREALEEYGMHKGMCQLENGGDDCDCGYWEAQAKGGDDE